MRRFFLCGLAAFAAAPAFAQPQGGAVAKDIAYPVQRNVGTKQKVMQAEAVVVGKVSSIDKETVEMEQYPGGPKVACAATWSAQCPTTMTARRTPT